MVGECGWGQGRGGVVVGECEWGRSVGVVGECGR